MSTRNYSWRRVFSLLLLIVITVNAPVGASSVAAAESTAEVFETETLKKVNHFDYYTDSISPLTDKAISKTEITEAMAPYGKYLGTPGMPIYAYRDAMQQKWEDATERDKKFTGVEMDLEKRYTYNRLVNIMKKLSRIDGVNLYKIGKSTENRDMYAIEVDIPSDAEKDTIILTGTIHARETAGCTYILKELVDLLQDNSAKARQTLSRTRFVAVPCVNPDGREGVCYNPETYSYKKGELWKATTSGTDLNRNFPGLSWSQLKKGYDKSDYLSTSPDKLYYPGPFAGSAPETRAMMKFLYHYVVIEKAALYIDYHQQGRIMYTEKPWCSSEQRKLCKDAADHFKEFLNNGQKKSSKNKYTAIKEDKEYGLNGVGSTMTDYACSIANGSKYSRAYGFNVYVTKTNEYPLIMIPHLDDTRKKLIEAPNPTLITFTFEIGWGKDSLGYSAKARSLIADEYTTFHYDKALFEMSEYVHGLRG